MNNIESAKGEIVMYQPDETIRLEVRMGEETVWLTQQQMAELFQRDQLMPRLSVSSDIAWRTSEHDKIKTIREYGHNVLFH